MICPHCNKSIGAKYLKPAEVAKLLNVSRATIYRWLNEDKLESVDFFGTVRIPKEAVDLLLKRNKY